MPLPPSLYPDTVYGIPILYRPCIDIAVDPFKTGDLLGSVELSKEQYRDDRKQNIRRSRPTQVD